MTSKTGLSKEEILGRLSRELPKAVDDLTPDGTVPTEDQFADIDRNPAPTSVPSVGRLA